LLNTKKEPYLRTATVKQGQKWKNSMVKVHEQGF
jgi:hypothetical protein